MTGVIEQELAVGAGAPAEARRVVERLHEHLRPDALDQVRLLVSELVTNSVRHAGLSHEETIALRVSTSDSSVRVEVVDTGPGFAPGTREPTLYQDSGWGLYLVEQIADRWGVERDPRTSVWFEIDKH